MHPAELPEDRLLAECDIVRTKRSGPGGQHRNKVETAVVLTHRPTGLTAEASERRSQAENQAVAIDRLRRTLAIEVRSPCHAPSESSSLWQTRLRGSRIEVSEEHADYPALLAESLDHLAAGDWNVAQVAAQLGTTSSQLVRLWKKEPRALALVNRQRGDRGLGRLE